MGTLDFYADPTGLVCSDFTISVPDTLADAPNGADIVTRPHSGISARGVLW